MPREVYDPKEKELEFYYKKNIKPPAPKREVSIFARRWFMFLYGTFITLIVVGLFLYKKGFFNNIAYFAKKTNIVEVKINNIDFSDEYIITTIELENYNYTNSENILKLNSDYSLYRNKKLVYSGNNSFYNVRFPLKQRIGFNLKFDIDYWKKSNKLKIILQFDDNLIQTNEINITKLRRRK